MLRSSTLAMVPTATFAITATVGLVYPAAAQHRRIETPAYTPDQESPSWRYRVGLGLALVPDYVGSDDYRFVPLPQLSPLVDGDDGGGSAHLWAGGAIVSYGW